MTIHFASFLFDLALWLLFGMGVGESVSRLEHRREDRIQLRFLFSTIAAGIGLLAVLGQGLPAKGFAGGIFFFVVTLTISFVLLKSQDIRTLVREMVKRTLLSHQHTYIVRGGELHGNNH